MKLKSGLYIIKSHNNIILKSGYGFLFAFYSKYGRILYNFGDNVQHICRKSQFFSYTLHSMTPLGSFLLEYCHTIWCGKTKMVCLPDGENSLMTRLAVYQRLTDGRTDRHLATA